MLFNSTKCVSTILILLFSLNVYSKSSNVIKLSCEYDPKSIKQELKDIGFLSNDEIDNSKICKFLNCKDVVEVIKNEILLYEYKNNITQFGISNQKSSISKKEEVVILNKTDSILKEEVEERLNLFKKENPQAKTFILSNFTKEGLQELIEYIKKMLQ